MAFFISTFFNEAQFKNDGTLAVGYKIYTYAEGSSTPLATYTSSTGATPQANPIVLNARGEPANPIWLTGGLGYKFVYMTDADVVIRTIDNVRGIGDNTLTVSQWVSSGLTATYISASSFSVVGDQTSAFHVGRAVQLLTSGGTVTAKIKTSAYTTLTTVTIEDATGNLDAGTSGTTPSLSILTNNPDALPSIIDSNVQNQTAIAFTTGGSSSAYTLTPIPAIASNAENQCFFIEPHTDPTGSPTLAISGKSALNCKYLDSTGTKQFITSSQVKAGNKYRVWNDGTDYIFGDILPQTSLLQNYFTGLGMSTAGASTTMTIAAGQASDSTNAAYMALSAAIAKTTSSWSVGTAAGGLDTGTIANSTWYHFYVIRRPDTGVVDVVFSTSASSPTLPTNYTQYRYLGSGKTNGSAQWTLFSQVGDTVLWDAATVDFDVVNPGTAAVSRTVNTPLGVKTLAQLSVGVGGFTTGALQAVFSSLDVSDQAPQAGTTAALTGFNSSGGAGTANAWSFMPHDIRTNTSSQIRTRLSASGASDRIGCITRGWTYIR